MAQRPRGGGSRRDDDDGDRGDREHERRREHEREGEPYDNPKEHLVIERRRFEGGLPPTPELYALAREQWYGLPGAVVRPSMDPPIGAPEQPQSPDAAHPSGKGPEQ
jgi:hypothetical protein